MAKVVTLFDPATGGEKFAIPPPTPTAFDCVEVCAPGTGCDAVDVLIGTTGTLIRHLNAGGTTNPTGDICSPAGTVQVPQFGATCGWRNLNQYTQPCPLYSDTILGDLWEFTTSYFFRVFCDDINQKWVCRVRWRVQILQHDQGGPIGYIDDYNIEYTKPLAICPYGNYEVDTNTLVIVQQQSPMGLWLFGNNATQWGTIVITPV